MFIRLIFFWETEGDHQAIKIANTAIIESQKLPQKNLARVAANNKKGQLLVHMAKTEEAKLSFQEAESSIPPNDSINGTVASLYNNISWMFLNLNLFKEALDYAVRSLEIQLELYGPDARQLMGVYQSLGLIANGAGWFEEAEKYSLKLYNIATANLPPSHPTMGLVHNQLVIIYESMSRYTKALFHLKAMIEVTQKAYEESGNPHFLAIAIITRDSCIIPLEKIPLQKLTSKKLSGFIRSIMAIKNWVSFSHWLIWQKRSEVLKNSKKQIRFLQKLICSRLSLIMKISKDWQTWKAKSGNYTKTGKIFQKRKNGMSKR